ncbi:MAG: hypothetical protein J2P25_24050, partial [Nocardiopsaceae bacterium]|nr:hypothetical protein [Nocardiopsaceae bacterium]
MTRYGAPDDDMPDTFPLPPSGPQPFDERDLDSLLAGGADVPASLRPVADTLKALQAAPSADELRGEAAARAWFRSPVPEVPAARRTHRV